MLIANCVNTSIYCSVFHNLYAHVARCSASCVNWAPKCFHVECPSVVCVMGTFHKSLADDNTVCGKRLWGLIHTLTQMRMFFLWCCLRAVWTLPLMTTGSICLRCVLCELGLIHTGRALATRATGTFWCEWECPHWMQATSKGLHLNLHACVLCGFGLKEGNTRR